ncbi:MAG TPA: hypothetical protein VFM96_07680 [Gaiellaceae bacterium]|nr:hypothetical protein [Gaiellaceae bacterium]
MPTYLLTFQPPLDYDAPADTFDRWAMWHVELGELLNHDDAFDERLDDRR